jgi:hypothetical protein
VFVRFGLHVKAFVPVTEECPGSRDLTVVR